MAQDLLFTKIINGDLPADIVFSNERVTAFRDVHPQAPTHILIIPNKRIPTVNDIEKEDEAVIGELFSVAKRLAKQEGLSEDGFRLIVNCNQHGGQEVYHLHMHLLGGKPLGPMLSA